MAKRRMKQEPLYDVFGDLAVAPLQIMTTPFPPDKKTKRATKKQRSRRR